MRNWIHLLSLVAVALCLAAAAAAQSMMEHAAAAAGSAVGAAGGKKVSEGIDSIMGRTARTADGASRTGAKAKKDSASPRKEGLSLTDRLGTPSLTAPARPSPLPTANGSVVAPVRLPRLASPAVKKRTPSPRTAAVASPGFEQEARAPEPPPVAASLPPAAAPAPPAVEPKPEDFSAIAAGAGREEVLRLLGKPSSRLTMADESGMVETYSYRNLGSLRLVNGKVSEVRPAN